MTSTMPAQCVSSCDVRGFSISYTFASKLRSSFSFRMLQKLLYQSGQSNKYCLRYNTYLFHIALLQVT